ncbi:MAG: MazG nucleotide pyrophosphohydrolase domain-containing protein [Polyangiaceae bacterium]
MSTDASRKPIPSNPEITELEGAPEMEMLDTGDRPTLELPPIRLHDAAPMSEYQRYIKQLEEHHGWSDVSLIENCFLMGEEVGELFKSVRKVKGFYDQAEAPTEERAELVANVGEEIVDVLNYLLAIANRLDIDVERAFIEKNTKNLSRSWKA